MKSLEGKLLASTTLPALIGSGVLLGGALAFSSPVQAGADNLNPPAISRAASGMLMPVAMKNPCAAKSNPCNPCAPKKMTANPCNPCAAKKVGKAGTPRNPCAAAADVDRRLIVRPKGTMLYQGDRAALMSEGKKLFMNTRLSTNGLSCQSCHGNLESFTSTFTEPFPHKVEMAVDSSGVDSVALDEMIQLCMVVPMEAKPFPWDSRKLAALTAYAASLQKTFIARGTNPCNPAAAKNPSAVKNPCNPCAAKNPCAAN